MGGDATVILLAAAFARRRFNDHPRQCALADRRMDQRTGPLASARMALGHSVAPHYLLAEPSAVRAARRGCPFLSALHPQPDSANSLLARHAQRVARRVSALAGGDGSDLRLTLHSRHVGAFARKRAQAYRRVAPPDTAGRRTHQPQPRRPDRTPGRPLAAAAIIYRAAGGAAGRAQ